MPLRQIDPEGWKVSIRRTLIVGGPNKRKTSSLATWPRPLHAVIYPGEGGGAALVPSDDVKVYSWEADLTKPESPEAVLRDLRKLVIDIISGVHGPVQTIALDGLHKLYELILEAVTGGASAAGDDFEPRMYSQAHARFLEHLKLVKTSAVPYAVFTIWDGSEVLAENLGGKVDSKAPKAMFPELPGKMAKRVMGEFPVVLYAELEPPSLNPAGPPPKAWWRLHPTRETQAAGVKLPPAIAAKLPPTVPQNWKALEPLLLGQPATP